MSRRVAVVIALVWLMLLCGACFAQQIEVRVINANDRKPLTQETVLVQFLNPESSLRLQTDRLGQVRFSLPNPIPAHVNVRVTLKSEYWHCGCWVMTDTSKVMQNGVMQLAPTKNGTASGFIAAPPDPGQILIFARPFTLGERLLYPFVKQ